MSSEKHTTATVNGVLPGLPPLRWAQRLSLIVLALMILQAASARMMPYLYRDSEIIRVGWAGNDWFTLLVGATLLAIGVWGSSRGEARPRLLWLGALAYSVYNYGFYLFGTTINAFFPLYCLLFVVSVTALIFTFISTNSREIAETFRFKTPVRLIGGYMILTAAGLAAVWLVTWATHIFADKPLPGGTQVFTVVAALDLTLMVPGLVVGGLLLWRRHRWGYVIAAVAGVQAALYLWLLALNTLLAIRTGLVTSPAELPVWLPLAATMTIATVVLLVNAGHRTR